MTSESLEKERKRRLLLHAFFQRHKRKMVWAIAAALVVSVLGILTPSHTVISCDDPTIRRTYHTDTISPLVLLCISLLLPFFVITGLEWAIPPVGMELNKSNLRRALTQGWSYTSDLFVGGLFMYFLNDLAKLMVAEPRPNFWNTCNPNITAEQCQEKYITVTWKDCTNPMKLSYPRIVDSMKSFPSGHASISVFSSIFMIVYIHQRLWRRWSLLAGPWLQLVWASWALVCCQSRVWDNMHHWWDVLAGGLLGAFGSFLTLHYLSNWFDRTKIEDLVPGQIGNSHEGAPYQRQSNHSSTYSRTSIKRLISNTSDTDSQTDPRPPRDTRELRDINGTP